MNHRKIAARNAVFTFSAPGAVFILVAAGVDGGAGIANARVAITTEGGWRVIQSNGLPGHRTGRFPNAGNPHTVSAIAFACRCGPGRPGGSRRLA